MPDELRQRIHGAVLSHASDIYGLDSLAEMIADAIEVAMNWQNDTTTNEVTT